MEPGDIIFYSYSGNPQHISGIGIYIGDDGNPLWPIRIRSQLGVGLLKISEIVNPFVQLNIWEISKDE